MNYNFHYIMLIQKAQQRQKVERLNEFVEHHLIPPGRFSLVSKKDGGYFQTIKLTQKEKRVADKLIIKIYGTSLKNGLNFKSSIKTEKVRKKITRLTIEERINRRIKVNEETGCHEWIGYCDKNGIGHIEINDKMERVHRVVWELHNGNIKDNLFISHRCNNKKCCNILHLFKKNENVSEVKKIKATDDIKEYLKEWRKEHKVEVREYLKKWRKNNPEYLKKWRKNNPDYNKNRKNNSI